MRRFDRPLASRPGSRKGKTARVGICWAAVRCSVPIGLLFVLAVLAAAPTHAARMLVREVKAERASDEDTAAALTRMIETEVLRAAPEVEVLSWRAVAATLETAEVADCLGDLDTAACASDIGGALGVQLILSPHLARLGSVRVVTVSLYRMGDATVAGQAVRRVPLDDDDALIGASLEAVHEALEAAGLRVVAGPPAQPLQRGRSSGDGVGPVSALPWMLGAGGVVLVLASAGLHAGVFFAFVQPYSRGELARETARQWEQQAPLWLTLPWLGYAAGGALLAGALVGGWVLYE